MQPPNASPGNEGRRDARSPTSHANPVEAPTGIEPVEDLLRQLEPNLLLFEAKVRLYAEHFREADRGEMRQA